MGEKMKAQFEDCLKRGKIKEFSDAKKLIKKELNIAENDLKVADDGLTEGRWKWSTIQAYYSMFHTARALLFSKGYREKSHYCLRVAIETLFVEKGLIPEEQVEAFQMAKVMRENADYEENYSENGAKKLVKIAGDFLRTARDILKSV